MKIKNKILSLINHGLSGELLSQLNEGQINALYGKLSEQVTKQTIEVQKVGPEGGQIKIDPTKKTLSLSKDPNNPNTFKVTQTESEMTEDSDAGDLDLALALQSKEMNEKFESKAQQKYFWARCNRSKGKEKEKWCTMAKEFSEKTSKKEYKKMPEKIHPEKTVKVKKEQKEGYLDMIGKAMNKNMQNKIADIKPGVNWVSELENRINKLIEFHLSPKMTKGDLVRLVSETETAPAPVKPKTPTKPKLKPKIDPDFDPFGDPDPLDDPEARNIEVTPTEPITKPKPKIEPKPDTDFDPFIDPDPLDDPEAKSDNGFREFMKQVINIGMLKK